MRALVVGGAGSLGSAVVTRLLEDPAAHVTVVDDLSARFIVVNLPKPIVGRIDVERQAQRVRTARREGVVKR